jgi:uncharacterized protein
MTWDLLHAGLGWSVASVILAFSFVSSLITAGFGIGGGAIMLAVLASLLPPAAIIPVHGLVQLGSNAGRMAILLRHVHPVVIVPFSIGAIIGVSLGGLFVVQLNAGLLQICLGLFILWSILFQPPAFLRTSSTLAGGFSSFLTMFVGGTGPFVAAYVKALGLDRMGHVATHAMLMTIQHLLKTLVFGFLGFAFAQWAGFIALLVGFGFLGTLVGRKILTASNEKRFKFVLNAILGVLAARLIYAGSVDLWFSPVSGAL